MSRGEFLSNLHATTMTMHIAEAANVHEDVEAELLPGAVGSQHLVVVAAMTQAQIDDFPLHLRSQAVQLIANLAIRVLAMLVEQSSSEFKLERIRIEQINQPGALNGSGLHQLSRSLPQLAPSFNFVNAGISVLDQGGCYPNFLQQFPRCALSQFRVRRPNLFH